MPSCLAPFGAALAFVLLCAGHAFAQASFDIKTVDPETFRAIAFKVSEAQRPDIDGRLTEEAWAKEQEDIHPLRAFEALPEERAALLPTLGGLWRSVTGR